MQHISQRIHMHIPRYNWIGFYLFDQKNSTALVLGPHTGSFTPASRISLNQGLCGSAASSGTVAVTDNVAEDPRCIQGSDIVKSQMAVPIQAGGKTIGVFSIESYFLSTFKPDQEREFVEACAKVVGKCFERIAVPGLVNA